MSVSRATTVPTMGTGMNRVGLMTAAGLLVPVLLVGTALSSTGAINLGQVLTWLAFLASIVTGLAYLAAMTGRAGAESAARAAYRVQWVALVAGVAFLWYILFSHQYQNQYVASY